MSDKIRSNVLCKDVPRDCTRELQSPVREERNGISTGVGTAITGARSASRCTPAGVDHSAHLPHDG